MKAGFCTRVLGAVSTPFLVHGIRVEVSGGDAWIQEQHAALRKSVDYMIEQRAALRKSVDYMIDEMSGALEPFMIDEVLDYMIDEMSGALEPFMIDEVFDFFGPLVSLLPWNGDHQSNDALFEAEREAAWRKQVDYMINEFASSQESTDDSSNDSIPTDSGQPKSLRGEVEESDSIRTLADQRKKDSA